MGTSETVVVASVVVDGHDAALARLAPELEAAGSQAVRAGVRTGSRRRTSKSPICGARSPSTPATGSSPAAQQHSRQQTGRQAAQPPCRRRPRWRHAHRLDDSKTQYKIRLDAIDAPELGQPFGQASKKALSEKVFGKDVVVIAKTRDKYGRTVGHVLIDGRDVNLEMLEEGMAWHYKHYDYNARLSRAEEEAHAAKKGLWADGDPVPPWEWRKEHQHRKASVKP